MPDLISLRTGPIMRKTIKETEMSRLIARVPLVGFRAS
jgi:hypothetical protein